MVKSKVIVLVREDAPLRALLTFSVGSQGAEPGDRDVRIATGHRSLLCLDRHCGRFATPRKRGRFLKVVLRH